MLDLPRSTPTKDKVEQRGEHFKSKGQGYLRFRSKKRIKIKAKERRHINIPVKVDRRAKEAVV